MKEKTNQTLIRSKMTGSCGEPWSSTSCRDTVHKSICVKNQKKYCDGKTNQKWIIIIIIFENWTHYKARDPVKVKEYSILLWWMRCMMRMKVIVVGIEDYEDKGDK